MGYWRSWKLTQLWFLNAPWEDLNPITLRVKRQVRGEVPHTSASAAEVGHKTNISSAQSPISASSISCNLNLKVWPSRGMCINGSVLLRCCWPPLPVAARTQHRLRPRWRPWPVVSGQSTLLRSLSIMWTLWKAFYVLVSPLVLDEKMEANVSFPVQKLHRS